MRNLIVPKSFNEKKLIAYLQGSFPALKQSSIFKALRNKDIRVNGVKIRENVVLHEGDRITLYIEDHLLFPSFVPDVVFEDENILIIHKPAGIEVVGNENSITSLLCAYFQNPSISPCHRLDYNTMGLLLFAKKKEVLPILLDAFKNHAIEKHYLAKVYGVPKLPKATLEAFLFKDSKLSKVYISDVFKKGYVKIKTSYQVISSNKDTNVSLLDVTLHTGKTHQIRAHLAHIGLPIIGDEKYGNFEVNKQLHCRVQQLQSYKLCFHFPSTDGMLHYLDGKEFCIPYAFHL